VSSPPNYCQNLWNRFNKVDLARKNCADTFDVANREGTADFEELNHQVTMLEAELQLMESEWEKSFVLLPDGRELFGSEYNLLDNLIERDNPGERSEVLEALKLNYLGCITVLWMPYGEITNFSDYKKFRFLEEIYLRKANLIDVTGIRELTKLKNLGIAQIKSNFPELLKSIGCLKNLELLDLSTNQGITDISALSGLTKLKELLITDTKISDVTVLKNLTSLEIVGAGGVNADLSVLESLPNLKEVYIDDWGDRAKENKMIIQRLVNKGVKIGT
jgi:Leucine-rich repeat (LRR) protein